MPRSMSCTCTSLGSSEGIDSATVLFKLSAIGADSRSVCCVLAINILDMHSTARVRNVPFRRNKHSLLPVFPISNLARNRQKKHESLLTLRPAQCAQRRCPRVQENRRKKDRSDLSSLPRCRLSCCSSYPDVRTVRHNQCRLRRGSGTDRRTRYSDHRRNCHTHSDTGIN